MSGGFDFWTLQSPVRVSDIRVTFRRQLGDPCAIRGRLARAQWSILPGWNTGVNEESGGARQMGVVGFLQSHTNLRRSWRRPQSRTGSTSAWKITP